MKRILFVLAMAGATGSGAAFAQQTPAGTGPSGAETETLPSEPSAPETTPSPPETLPSDTDQNTQAAPVTPQAPVAQPAPAPAPAPVAQPEPPKAEPACPAPGTAPSGAINPEPEPMTAEAPAVVPTEREQSRHGPLITVQGEAGVQAFSGQLSHALRAGPAWGVSAKIRPRIPLALELRYQGASNQLFGSGNFWDGPRQARVIQNSGQAMLDLSLTGERARVEPFIGGGIGIAGYHVTSAVPGFQSDTVGQVPVSAGLNFHVRPVQAVGDFTVGLRADYDFLFSNQFAPTDMRTDYGVFTKQGGDQYRGELTIGGSF